MHSSYPHEPLSYNTINKKILKQLVQDFLLKINFIYFKPATIFFAISSCCSITFKVLFAHSLTL